MWLIACVGKLGGKFEGEDSQVVKTVTHLGQGTESRMLILRGAWFELPSLGTNLSMELEYHLQCVH